MKGSAEPGDVLVVGSINADLVIRSARLPMRGETITGGEFYQASGGKGANQAVASARTSSGLVRFISAAGQDEFGRRSLQSLRESGVDTSLVHQVHDVPTGVALILVDHSGENLISVSPGANLSLRPVEIDRINDRHLESRVVLCSLEIPLATVQNVLARCRSLGAVTILNPAPCIPELKQLDLRQTTDILTPNESELQALTGCSSEHSDDIVAGARSVIADGPMKVIVTRGERGALLITASDVMQIPSFPVKAVDSTAAGDAFNGALASRLATGEKLQDACRWASGAAALSVMNRGAQPSLPMTEAVERFLAEQTM